MKTKEIKLKELDKNQQQVIKHINNIVKEQKEIFGSEPDEILISKKDYDILSLEEDLNYMLFGKIKIYSI